MCNVLFFYSSNQRCHGSHLQFLFICREGLLSSLLPQVGMEFNAVDEAWMFWISYGGQKGFEVRKMYANKRKIDGKVRSCRYVCANEGHKKPEPRTRQSTMPFLPSLSAGVGKGIGVLSFATPQSL